MTDVTANATDDAAARDKPTRDKPAGDAPSSDGTPRPVFSPESSEEAAGRPTSEAEGVARLKSLAADWFGLALADRFVDDVLRRTRDDGLVSGGALYAGNGPVYNTYINGAQVAGSLNIGKLRTRAGTVKRLHQVPQEDLAFIKQIYTCPDGISVAEGLFQTRQMVILKGARSSGLQTAGLWLAATHAAVGKVFLLSPDRLVTALRRGELDKGAAYVVPGLDSATTAQLTDFTLAEIEEWLTGGRWLVITMNSATTMHRDLAGHECVVDGIGWPDPVEVAAKHGLYELNRLRASGTPAEDPAPRFHVWLEEDDIRAWLRARPEPRLAAQAGRSLARTAQDGEDPRVTLRLLEDPQAHAAQWFQDHPHTAERAFMVAAAVLAGSSYVAVADAAAALDKELKGFQVRNERQDFWSTLADESWLEIVQESHPTPFGVLPVEVVRIRSGRIQNAILEHAWRRIDGMRMAMCKWLRTLGGNNSTEVRGRAGATAGILTLWDLEYVLNHILLGWAGSKSADEREAAALALSIPASDTRFSDATWRLVLGWCDPEAKPERELTKTAIRALGGRLGAQEPETAIAALREIIEAWSWAHVPDVTLSLVVLTADGRFMAVLSALLDWTQRKPAPSLLDRELRLIGLSCFLMCAGAYDATPDKAGHPIILGPSGEGVRSAAYLWGRALDTHTLRPWALELLRAWFELRDGRYQYQDEDEDYILQLVRVIAGLDDHQRQRLEHHCYRWASDAKHPSETAKDALALLRESSARVRQVT